MMVTQHPRRTREITGPTPHSVAIIAKGPSKRAAEHLTLSRRKEDDQRRVHEDMIRYVKQCDLKNDWEKNTDKKIQENTIQRRVKGLLQINEFSLEDRREKLRNLLAQEEQEYAMQMEANEETVLERQAKMRARARELRDKRESERLEIVKEKLDQQWRNQCEELRSTMSKRKQDMIAAERMEQLKVKEEIEKEKQEEEKVFTDMWYADIAAKALREEVETKKRQAANREMVEVLQLQMAALEAQKAEERRLKEEEAEILKEQNALRKLEEQALLEEKRRQQLETRKMYSDSVEQKRQRLAKELQEQLAFDMKILEQLLEESKNEAMEMATRKRELREEDKRYRDYLKKLKEEEEQKEKELDRLCDIEVEKMWQRKIQQWKLEKAARRKLLEEVMAARRVQLQEKLLANERKQAEAQRDREELMRKIEENKALDEQHRAQLKAKNLSYQNDLLGQMDYNRRLAALDQNEEQRMFEAQQDAELEYRRKLEEALANPSLNNLHPMRRSAYNSASNRKQPLSG